MFAILIFVVIVSGAALAIMVVVKVRAAKRSRICRTVASPYGMLVGPTDAELRRTREVHAESLQVWRANCPSCSGTGYVLGAEGERLGIQCGRCHGRGDILTQGRV